MTPDELRARVPLFGAATEVSVAPLEGAIGTNNANFRAVADGEAFFVRVGSPNARYLGIHRGEERAALTAAAEVGLTPPLLYADPSGLLVQPFLARARHWTPQEAARPENVARLARALRQLHVLTEVEAPCTIYERIERLLVSAVDLGQEPPAYLDRLRKWLDGLRARRAADARFPPGLCHGDFWLHNFLDEGGERLWLIDWEFAGIGDGMIDLAKLAIGGSEYQPEDRRRLLLAYGYAEPADLEILGEMTKVLRFFEALWALVRHGLGGSETGFDFLDHSRKTFASL